MNLGIGAYRDEDGKPWVLPVVRKVERQLASDSTIDKEYLDIGGLKAFCEQSGVLILGKEWMHNNKDRVGAVQAISGTGAIRIGAEFVARFLPGSIAYGSKPTWGNHKAIFNDCRVEYREYRYWNTKTNSLDMAGLLEDLKNAPEKSVIVLHACAHNPTGMDPTADEWKQIADVIRAKKHVPFFDSAYQGFASGDLDRDAFAVRYFASEGFEMIIAQSYAKNFGLYAERAGCVSVVCSTADAAAAAASQLKLIVRPMYSNPPKHGALIVQTVLSNPELYQEWVDNLKTMASRIARVRQLLYDALVARNTPGDWSHVIKQIGMFSFTGLTEPQVTRLVNEFHIYMLQNGRISLAGLSERTVPYLADSIYKVVTQHSSL
jgi:aspartate aminotransferase